MEDILHELVELSNEDLDKVAGGNPFSFSINSGSFAIGLVQGDFSSATASSNAGQVNTFGGNFA